MWDDEAIEEKGEGLGKPARRALHSFLNSAKSPLMKKAQVETAIVAFIDILGYKDLVNRLINKFEAIRDLEIVLQGASADLITGLREKLSFTEPRYQEYSKNIFNSISAKYISDTILITMRLSRMDLSFPDFTREENLSHYAFSYFYFISLVCNHFTGKTGLVVRGGISMGPHYEKPQNESLFIFSQAYINACQLEHKADTPRILIDTLVYDFIKDLPLKELPNFIFVDSSGKMCLDIYGIFENEERSPIMLSEIKEGVQRNIVSSRSDKGALRKLIEFAKYHNKKVLEFGFKDVAIDLSKVEKHFQTL